MAIEYFIYKKIVKSHFAFFLQGCQSCSCDPIGSINKTCDISTGHCYCRPGVTGKRCDMCKPHHYGFSDEGCKPCDCDEIGSKELQCDPSGQCPVRTCFAFF